MSTNPKTKPHVMPNTNNSTDSKLRIALAKRGLKGTQSGNIAVPTHKQKVLNRIAKLEREVGLHQSFY